MGWRKRLLINKSQIPVQVATTTPTGKEDSINVTSPRANSLITSPLTVTGNARGMWYFEASFPVEILDGNNSRLAVTPAQAQGDWMTENFVPFSVTLNFKQPTTATGTLVLHKDNPSGDPSKEDSLRIPIRFK